jgi:uncharacterized phage protein (TIGR02220 family)
VGRIVEDNDNSIDALLGLFSQDNYIVVNMALARTIGLNETILYTNLLVKYRYYKKHKQCTQIGGVDYFFSTIEDLEHSTTLTRKQQDMAIATLEELGLIRKKLMGMPAKRFFRIVSNAYALNAIIQIVSSGQASLSEKYNLDCPKGTTKNNLYKNNQIKNKELDKSNSCRAVPPDFIKEVVEYLNQKTGKHYHPTTTKTKRCISARWREGFHNIEDYKKVIDTKYAQWSNDLKMCVYIRPETLFGTKFEGYLNEVDTNVRQEQPSTPKPKYADEVISEAEREWMRERYAEIDAELEGR